jgi:hypothetical protein
MMKNEGDVACERVTQSDPLTDTDANRRSSTKGRKTPESGTP